MLGCGDAASNGCRRRAGVGLLRLHFGQRDAASLDARTLQELHTIQQSGFGIALDSGCLTGVQAGVLDMRRTAVVVDRAAVDLVAKETGPGRRLQDKLAEMAANGAMIVACGIASARCEQVAQRLGFRRLQGDHFPLPPEVARMLDAINAD